MLMRAGTRTMKPTIVSEPGSIPAVGLRVGRQASVDHFAAKPLRTDKQVSVWPEMAIIFVMGKGIVMMWLAHDQMRWVLELLVEFSKSAGGFTRPSGTEANP